LEPPRIPGRFNEIPTVRLGRWLVVPLTRLAAMLDGEHSTPTREQRAEHDEVG
jgi:hypothetical protein